MPSDHEELRRRYEAIALTGDDDTTACDFQLRELEIALGLEYMRDGDVVLDVGCGPGVALRRYTAGRSIEAHGLDYAQNMVALAERRARELCPAAPIRFHQGSVSETSFQDATFDVVTSHRCLMALLDWDLQQRALGEIHRVLKPGATLVLMEGTFEGLERLNFYRRMFSLPEIDPAGRDRLYTLKFHEQQLLSFMAPRFDLLRIQRFGMYYFLTRIVQPLLVAPEQPRYDHRLNEVAKQIARLVPDFESIGHLVGFVFRKR